MKIALEHANCSLDSNEVPIAALLFHEPSGKILGKSHNMTNETLNGTTHAEFQLYNTIMELQPDKHLQLWKESVLVVTVEPCIMCASLLDQLGVKTVVFGCGNDRFGGNGSVFRIQRKYKVIPGVLDKDAIRLLRKFYIRENDLSPNQIGKKLRILKLDDFPILDYKKYIDYEDFISQWGVESGFMWKDNIPLEFNEKGELIIIKKSHKVHINDEEEEETKEVSLPKRVHL